MSIVEKALQKAQQSAAAQPAQPGRPADIPEGSPAAGAPEPRWTDPDAAREAPSPRPAVAAGPARQSVVVDPTRLRQFGLLPAEDLLAEALDEFRRIKWPLLESALGRSHSGTVAAENNLILVTSAIAEEGKSFTALNLAGTIGRERDCRAILVDADLSSPKITRALGLEDRKGLHDLLADESLTVEDILYETDIEGLLFVPAGTRGESGPELLASRRMAQVCAGLSQWVHDGVVLFDSSPLLLSNESQVISRLVGQVLMVVRADFTEQRMVREAIGLLDRTKLISTVLNNVQRTGIGDDPMTYGYGYGYGSRKRYGSPRGGSR
jgi:exopolysaccharide/PEP-CTERM locus tyrosine autokinase